MAEITTSTYKQTNKVLEESFGCMKNLKKKIRILNANITNIHDIGITKGDDVNEIQTILERKAEATKELKQVIQICEECTINFEKLEIASVQRREERGRCNNDEGDSGYISKELKNHVLSGLQDISPHAHPQINDNNCNGNQKSFGDETDC